ncbi:MAG TPA: EAL domain-containing protein [Alphaproteobacteria bacterium]|nr:EAL domain-containing protein [Alphaproteobacteria bacterium]
MADKDATAPDSASRPENGSPSSELHYRRLFEAAPDGILVLEATSGRILEANPFLAELLGHAGDWFPGKYLWDIGIFGEPEQARRAFEELSDKGYLRLEGLPLAAKDGRRIEIEFIANSYQENGAKAIQCNVRDITERKLAERRMARLAWTDPLTRLPNRRTFDERLKEAFSSTGRGARGFAVLYLDVDHFKDINDTLGHQKGDLLLKEVATRLKASMRETDLVARFGGDEFAILQTNVTDPADAGALAEKIRASLAAPYRIDGNEVRTTVSIGIALYSNDIARADTMVSQADLALYRAKEEGRNRFSFHTRELDHEVGDRVALGNELRTALQRGEFELYYQPQVELNSGNITRLEALVRWFNPRRGPVPPLVFIPVAEKTGSIVPIGRYVIKQICRQLKEWREAGLSSPVVSINLSATQFKLAQNVEHDIAESIEAYGIIPENVEIELTESVLQAAAREHRDALDRLRRLGVRLVIDDFGTGYSSLEYLKALPVSRLKIAQQFMIDAPRDLGHAAIVRATISLAREFGLDVIAEGVETRDQVGFLLAFGCTTAQGYYFSRPVNAARAAELLRQGSIRPALGPS